jgi:hypothetical protein
VVEAERQPDQVAEEGREEDLTQARHDRYRAEGPYQLHVELDADEEQEHGDSQFGKKQDLLVGTHQIESGRPRDQPHGDEAHDEGLPQQRADQPDPCCEGQQQRHFGERVEHGYHEVNPTAPRRIAGRRQQAPDASLTFPSRAFHPLSSNNSPSRLRLSRGE